MYLDLCTIVSVHGYFMVSKLKNYAALVSHNQFISPIKDIAQSFKFLIAKPIFHLSLFLGST